MEVNIGIMSDLHWEVEGFSPPHLAGVNVLVAAGDMLSGREGSAVGRLAQCGHYDLPVVYVPGNHEFDGLSIAQGVQRLRKTAAYTNVHLLYNDVWIHKGVRFLGTTLWTDFLLFGADKLDASLERARKFGDFQAKRQDGSVLTTEEVIREHQVALEFLRVQLNTPHDGPTVVVTHFAPTNGSLAAKYAEELASAWFVNNLDPAMVVLADLWIHGHTHTSFDYVVRHHERACRVVCNPGGFSQTIQLKGQPLSTQALLLSHYPELLITPQIVLRENPQFANPLIVSVG